jgi:hypothetical protein
MRREGGREMKRHSLVAGIGVVVVLSAVSFPGQAWAKKAKTFLASSDAKEGDEPQAYLPDYSKLVKGDDADWVWFPNGSLRSYKMVLIKPFTSNAVDTHKIDGRHAAEYAPDYLKNWLEKQGFQVVESGPSEMVIEGNVFNAWEPSGGARFWGGVFANPGAGVEVICKDAKGTVLGFVRHKSRGSTIKDAVENGLEEVAKAIAKGK